MSTPGRFHLSSKSVSELLFSTISDVFCFNWPVNCIISNRRSHQWIQTWNFSAAFCIQRLYIWVGHFKWELPRSFQNMSTNQNLFSTVLQHCKYTVQLYVWSYFACHLGTCFVCLCSYEGNHEKCDITVYWLRSAGKSWTNKIIILSSDWEKMWLEDSGDVLTFNLGWRWSCTITTRQEDQQFYNACALSLVQENDQGLVFFQLL